MSRTGMPTNIRLTQQEQELLRQKAIEINKALVKQGKQPLRDSELVHKILEKALPSVRLTQSGEVALEVEP